MFSRGWRRDVLVISVSFLLDDSEYRLQEKGGELESPAVGGHSVPPSPRDAGSEGTELAGPMLLLPKLCL